MDIFNLNVKSGELHMFGGAGGKDESCGGNYQNIKVSHYSSLLTVNRKRMKPVPWAP